MHKHCCPIAPQLKHTDVASPAHDRGQHVAFNIIWGRERGGWLGRLVMSLCNGAMVGVVRDWRKAYILYDAMRIANQFKYSDESKLD